MSKSEVGYSSDTERSLFFLRSIQEPALLSQSKSLEVCIINENALAPINLKGRAPLPSHLLIPALTETMKQTIQPITFSGESHRTQATNFPPYYSFGIPGHSPYDPSGNLHIMQGSHTFHDAAANWTERQRKKGDNRPPRKPDGRNKRVSTPKEKDPSPKPVCQACFVPGHEAATCWTLARALLASDFIHNLVNKDTLQRVVENYKQRFHLPESPRANKLCHETMWHYCIDNRTTPEHVCRQFNWLGIMDDENVSEEESGNDSSDADGEPSEERM
jgi:hypothetical protein